MKIRYMKVSGDTAKPLPDRLADKATHELNLKNADYDKYSSSDDFKVVDGKPILLTIEEMSERDLIANKNNVKQDLKAKRDEELNAITVEVNGKVFQSRKSDEMNFRLVLGTMQDGDTEEWILEDDSVVEVTKAEIEEAYLKGLAEGKRIFAEYKEALKAL